MMATAEVDVAYLAAQVGVPELDINTAVTAPTPEVVRIILKAVASKLRDFEQEKFQLEIELEGAIRSSESRCEQFKATTDKALKDVEQLRQKLQDEGRFPDSSNFRRDIHLIRSASQKTAEDPWRMSSRT